MKAMTTDVPGVAMIPVRYEPMLELSREGEILELMAALYREDPSSVSPDPAKFPETLRRFLDCPTAGRTMLFLRESELVGYALLVPYWSNEYGGNLVFIDELYVVPAARNGGIARSFFRFLERTRPFAGVSAALETTPGNLAARRLYQRVGFNVRSNATWICRWSATGLMP